MKKLFLLLLLMYPIVVSTQAEPLELTDGYFQSGKGRPVHLVHGLNSYQAVYLNEEFYLWYTINIRQGERLFCENHSCLATLRFLSTIGIDNVILAKDDLSFSRNNNKFDISYSFDLSDEKLTKGRGALVYTVVENGNIIFFHQIPVEIK